MTSPQGREKDVLTRILRGTPCLNDREKPGFKKIVDRTRGSRSSVLLSAPLGGEGCSRQHTAHRQQNFADRSQQLLSGAV